MAPAAAAVLRQASLSRSHPSAGRRPRRSADRVSLVLPASSSPPRVSWQRGSGAAIAIRGCVRANAASGSFERDRAGEDAVSPSPQGAEESGVEFMKILKSANTVIPHVVLGSTILALVYPPSFTWFTTRYYAPALGFLMFAVGVNSSVEDFIEAIKRPDAIAAGYVGHIVMTSLSTASAVFVTPTLSYLLIGKKLPVDVVGMMSSIVQIVVAPIAAGLLLNRFLPRLCSAIQPFLPPLSVFVTALCVGSPLAINIKAVLSPYGLSIVLLLLAFHTTSFVAGYHLAGTWFRKSADVKALQRTISFETGMQSSLLALALANRFFPDPLVGVPPAVSVVLMSLMGFGLVMLWSKKTLV
uniref:Uncharacterized protein n=1 Tax=Avena sativa TaxID=4498 RepID=A0ACD5YDK6_AVESA